MQEHVKWTRTKLLECYYFAAPNTFSSLVIPCFLDFVYADYEKNKWGLISLSLYVAAKEMPMSTVPSREFGSFELTSSGRSSMLTLTNYWNQMH